MCSLPVSSHYQSWLLPSAGDFLLPSRLCPRGLSHSFSSPLWVLLMWVGELMAVGREANTQGTTVSWPLCWVRHTSPAAAPFRALIAQCCTCVWTPFPKCSSPQLSRSLYLCLSLSLWVSLSLFKYGPQVYMTEFRVSLFHDLISAWVHAWPYIFAVILYRIKPNNIIHISINHCPLQELEQKQNLTSISVLYPIPYPSSLPRPLIFWILSLSFHVLCF